MARSTWIAIAAVLVIVVLYAAGAFGTLAQLLHEGAPAPGAEADWEVRITRLVFWDAASGDGVAASGVVCTIDEPDERSGECSGTRADLDDAGAQLDLEFTIFNLATSDRQIVVTHGDYSTVEAGAFDYPLVSEDQGVPRIVYTDGSGNGHEVEGRFFDVVPSDQSERVEAEIDVSETAVSNASTSGVYFLEVVIQNVATLRVDFDFTG